MPHFVGGCPHRRYRRCPHHARPHDSRAENSHALSPLAAHRGSSCTMEPWPLRISPRASTVVRPQRQRRTSTRRHGASSTTDRELSSGPDGARRSTTGRTTAGSRRVDSIDVEVVWHGEAELSGPDGDVARRSSATGSDANRERVARLRVGGGPRELASPAANRREALTSRFAEHSRIRLASVSIFCAKACARRMTLL